MAYVLQSGGLLEFLTVRENIRLAASLRRRPAGSQSAVLDALALRELMHRRPGTLSGGQRQRAAIACALVQEADIVLADEPTSALDAAGAGRLVETFARLTSESGSSLVLVTHDAALAARCADRVYRFSVEDCAARHARSTLAEVPAPVVTGAASW
jgi:putative ABC transport system ATP-binding protein